jgi:serine/threonine protein kinase
LRRSSPRALTNLIAHSILIQDDGITPLYKIGDLGLISLADATDFSEGDSRYISRDLFASDADCRKLTKADVFSLGCSVYELALGRALPSRGEEWNAIREGEIQLSSDFTKGFVNLLKVLIGTSHRASAFGPFSHPAAAFFLCCVRNSQCWRPMRTSDHQPTSCCRHR